MGDELAASNVNRSYSLAASSIAIFTFMLIFLYPRFASGEVNALLFQGTLVVMGVATFAFMFASFYSGRHRHRSSNSVRHEESVRGAIEYPGKPVFVGTLLTVHDVGFVYDTVRRLTDYLHRRVRTPGNEIRAMCSDLVVDTA